MEEKYEIDVQLDKKTLDHFLIRNNFLRAGGVAGLLISFAAILGLIVFWKEFATSQRVILVFLGAMFTIIQPVGILLKGRNQLKSGAFRKPFHYIFSEEGIQVKNIAGPVQVQWQQIRKVIVTREAMYIYMNSVSALIIPAHECDSSFEQIAILVKKKCEGRKKRGQRS